MKAIVIGAGGGIGAALADQLEQAGAAVIRLSRSSDPRIDFDEPETIEAAASCLSDTRFDLILVATGILHDETVEPEKTIRAIQVEALDRYFRVNATGPALLIRHFAPLLRRDGRSVMALLSARVGSIEDNRLGGWVGYRASKAALNQIVRTAAIELARTMPDTILAGLHPGTVDTALSAPFQRNVPPEQLFTPGQSAAHLLSVVERLAPADSGGCFDWRGNRIPA